MNISLQVIITSLQDEFPKWIKKYLKHHEILVMIVCLISFFSGLPNVTEVRRCYMKPCQSLDTQEPSS